MTNQEISQDVATMRAALDAARQGGASVSQLAHAHELAEKHHLPTVTAELRAHLRHVIPDPMNGHLPTARMICLGVISGVVTHLVLRLSSLRRKGSA